MRCLVLGHVGVQCLECSTSDKILIATYELTLIFPLSKHTACIATAPTPGVLLDYCMPCVTMVCRLRHESHMQSVKHGLASFLCVGEMHVYVSNLLHISSLGGHAVLRTDYQAAG